MKKLISFVFTVGLFILAGYQNTFAEERTNRMISSISVKGGYLSPVGNFADYDDSFSGGVAISTHPFFLEYGFMMVGVDYFEVMKKESNSLGTFESAISVTGVHLDLCWYLFPLAQYVGIGPYVGAGPAYNIYGKDEKGLGLGMDLFIGLTLYLCNHHTVMLFEARYKQIEFRESRQAVNISFGFWFFLDRTFP